MQSVRSRFSMPWVAALMYLFGAVVQPSTVLSGRKIDVPAEFCGDHHLVADRSERLADKLLVSERAIDLGRIEEGDAALDRCPYQGDHVLLVRGRAIAHASKPEGRDLKVAVSEFRLSGVCFTRHDLDR